MLQYVFGFGCFVAGSILRRGRPGRELAQVLDGMIPLLSLLERRLVRAKTGLGWWLFADANGSLQLAFMAWVRCY